VVFVSALACVAALAIVAATLLSGGDDSTSPASGDRAAAQALDGECASMHDGHDTMMWNAVMADEMLDVADCPWPYPPFDVDHDVLAFDQAVPALFEPRRYDEIWQMLGELDAGVCEIRSIADPPGGGFAFGFAYLVASPGCADSHEAVEVQVREYASQAARDFAAFEATAPLVLGRWVIVVDGGEPRRHAMVRGGFEGLGAVEP
jgi:hypothetical protein